MNKPIVQLVVGALCIAFAPIFVRLASMSPTASAFYRCGLAFLILLPFALRQHFKLSRKVSPRILFSVSFLVPGFIFSLDLFVWHKAVVYSGAGLATLLANTQVFYLAFIGALFFKEKIDRRYCLFALLAFLGIAVMVWFNEGRGQFENYILGVYLGLLTGVIYASYILAMRWTERRSTQIGIVTKMCCVSFWSAFFLGLFSVFESDTLSLAGKDWVYAILLALIPQITGWILITRSIARIDVSLSGLVILLQPVLAVLLAWLLLGENLNWMQAAGVFLALICISLGEKHRRCNL